MKAPLRLSAVLAGIGMAAITGQVALGQNAPATGQEGTPAGSAMEPAIAETMLTFRSHQLASGISAGNLEGNACPADFTMLSGACHPGYHDRVKIINQFPNRFANTWRCGFRNTAGTARTVWIYTLCGRAAATDMVQHPLQVRRFTTASLTDAQADSILADASTVAQVSDGPDDVACAVNLSRDGAVTAFTEGDGSIDSSAEFSAVIGLPGHVKVVNQINWCGGLIPNVIGCAPVPGNSFAVVRFTASLEGILWLHEFGHNKGLSHRNDVNAVMHPTIGSSRRQLNPAECDALRTQPLLAVAAATVMPQAGVGVVDRAHNGEADQAEQMDIEDFVRQAFVHGIPYEEARRYDSSVVPRLVEMLNDPQEEAHWPNVAVALAIIGGEEAVAPLVSFIEEDVEGELSRPHYAAKTSALMSLGYVVNQTGSREALNYLQQALDPVYWARMDVGRAPFQASTTERNHDFSKHAILGLALSGHPEAAQALRSLQRPAETEEQRAFQAQVGDLVSEALAEHAMIAREGLQEYYREQHR